MDLADFCDRDVVTIDLDDTLHQAAARMATANVGALVVTHQGRPAGFVTDRDLVVKALAENADLSGLRVSAVMSPHLMTVSKTATLSQAMHLMRDHQVRRLLIVDDGLRMCGLLSVDDLIAKIHKKSEEACVQLNLLSELIRLQSGTPSRHRSHDFTRMA